MILLGINCGFGNHDCGTLPQSALNLKNGWVNYPRPKTAIQRRCPLWPETVEAILESNARRPRAKQLKDSGLVFLTKYGQPWAKASSDSPVAKEFRKLLNQIDEAAVLDVRGRRARPVEKIHRHGLGFYTLRHTFETIGGESRDQVAVDHIMGHADASMASIYREAISDERLQNVVHVVRDWLFPKRRAK